MAPKQRIIIVTGASQGLGKAVAEALAGPETQLIITAKDAAAIEAVAAGLRAKEAACEARVFDVTHPDEIRQFVAWVDKTYGRVDILVNNAGWAGPKSPIEEVSEEDYRRYMATNLDSVFYLMHEVIPIMKRQKSGRIVNIASRASHRGHGGLAAYSASKFGVRGLTQAAGWELQGTGASCISISPAGINTAMRAAIFGNDDSTKQQSPEEVAGFVKQIVDGTLVVPNGGDVSIVRGAVTEVQDPLGSR